MRRATRNNIWYAAFERWEDNAEGWHRLPIMWPRLHPGWPLHPAVIVAAIMIVLLAWGLA